MLVLVYDCMEYELDQFDMNMLTSCLFVWIWIRESGSQLVCDLCARTCRRFFRCGGFLGFYCIEWTLHLEKTWIHIGCD